MGDEDDDDLLQGAYVDGHWEWQEKIGGLVYVSDLLAVEPSMHRVIRLVGASIEFKDDIDLIEQQRYKKRYQRKIMDGDVVTLQDIRDFVFFTTPVAVLTPNLINMLHQPGSDRFLRALILYTQYFLQISDVMIARNLERKKKVRTPESDRIEQMYHDNLLDLRMIVSKEYSVMIVGGAEFKRFHHMGPLKNGTSLSKKDAIFCESFTRICVQIVWIALGRKMFKNVEVEINRLFRSQKFNLVAHKAHWVYEDSLTPEEKFVLIGMCLPHKQQMLATRSPLYSEIKCADTSRDYDYRLLALGVVEYPELEDRLKYLERALILPEKELRLYGMSLGIIGLNHRRFDTVLREIALVGISASTINTKNKVKSLASGSIHSGTGATRMSTTSNVTKTKQIYSSIILPEKSRALKMIVSDDVFPEKSLKPQRVSNDRQRRKWQARYTRWRANRSSKKLSLPSSDQI